MITILTTLVLSLKIWAYNDGEKFLIKEGFSSKSPSENLRTAWENTFLFEFLNLEGADKGALSYGSTSVVFKEQKEGVIYLGLITNKHVYRPMPEYQMTLYKNIKQRDVGLRPVTDSAEKIEDVQYVSSTQSDDFDLALVIVKVSLEQGQNIKPLQFSQSCQLNSGDALVAIGFPRTSLRVADRENEKDELIWRVKRWSSGVYVGDVKQVRGPIFGTTVDALQGSSGGPVLDSHGNLAGTMAGIVGLNYTGNEDPDNYQSYSYIVDCQATKDFAQKSWQAFLQNKRNEI